MRQMAIEKDTFSVANCIRNCTYFELEFVDFFLILFKNLFSLLSFLIKYYLLLVLIIFPRSMFLFSKILLGFLQVK